MFFLCVDVAEWSKVRRTTRRHGAGFRHQSSGAGSNPAVYIFFCVFFFMSETRCFDEDYPELQRVLSVEAGASRCTWARETWSGAAGFRGEPSRETGRGAAAAARRTRPAWHLGQMESIERAAVNDTIKSNHPPQTSRRAAPKPTPKSSALGAGSELRNNRERALPAGHKGTAAS